MTHSDWTMPAVLQALHTLDIDYDDGEGIDFEPYSEFLDEDKTRSWFRAWTGNPEVQGSEYRIFGRDGTGGVAAIWLTLPDRPLLEQPIVFLGSEGQRGVVALNLDEYLWLLAGGIGPCEAIADPLREPRANPAFTAFAEQHSTVGERLPGEVMARARSQCPRFEEEIDALCR